MWLCLAMRFHYRSDQDPTWHGHATALHHGTANTALLDPRPRRLIGKPNRFQGGQKQFDSHSLSELASKCVSILAPVLELNLETILNMG